MNCQDMLRDFGDYIDGSIDPVLCAELKRHLDGCPACRVVIDTTKRTIALYRGEEPVALPSAFHDRLHDALRARWKERRGGATSGAQAG